MAKILLVKLEIIWFNLIFLFKFSCYYDYDLYFFSANLHGRGYDQMPFKSSITLTKWHT
jgi:hypothetical protein